MKNILLFLAFTMTSRFSNFYSINPGREELEQEDIEFKKMLKRILLERRYASALEAITDYTKNSYEEIKDDYNRNTDVLSDDLVTKKYNLSGFVNASEILTHLNVTFFAVQLPKPEYKQRFLEFIIRSQSCAIFSLSRFTNDQADYLKDETNSEDSPLHDTAFTEQTLSFHGRLRKRYHNPNWDDSTSFQIPVFKNFYKTFEYELVRDRLHLRHRTPVTTLWENRNPSIVSNRNIIVHCLAGDGRTGTFIMYCILKSFKKVSEDLFVDVFLYLRLRRHKLVTGEAHLKFLYTEFLLKREE